jgi:hypothetical protein
MKEQPSSCDLCSPVNHSIFCVQLLETRMKYDLEVSNKGIEIEEPISECPERLIIQDLKIR